jgi:hypothetical protein
MSLERVLTSLAKNLSGWVSTGLNEAQTSQVIVLPLLQALGYDIWNPYEVLAQGHSGGGSGAYAPDFAIKLETRTCFIIEVKALSREFSANDEIQAVNYVNALGRRWAVLTNGKAWHFYDNQISRPVNEKLSLTVELKNAKAPEYLFRLLARELWSNPEAETKLAAEVLAIATDIRKHLQLGEIEQKLQDELAAGFTADEKGLGRAIELTLEPNERELAQEAFAELVKRLLGVSSSLPHPPAALIDTPEVTDESSDRVIDAIRQGIETSKAFRRQSQKAKAELEAYLAGQSLEVSGWRDITAGIAEAALVMGYRDYLTKYGLLNVSRDERRKADGLPYPPSAYRQLSSGEFLYFNGDAAFQQRHIRQMLITLDSAPEVLQVTYLGKTYSLP